MDVFFVLSGYLITSIILKEMQAQKFSLVHFYERRVRRILPQLYIVMLVSVPFSWFYLLPNEMKAFSKSIIAVCIFVSNILFFQESGYFDLNTELKPLLHTWSLAVEEQFYFFFPLLLMFLMPAKKKKLFVSLIGLSLLSLLASVWLSKTSPSAAFYLIPTRAWELAIGALAAVYLLDADKPKASKYSAQFCLLGLSMILSSIYLFDDKTPFPSYTALLPTVGTVLIVIYGQTVNLVSKILSHPFLVQIGGISYGVYLWHQPLFAYARHSEASEPAAWVFWLLIFVSIFLAYICTKYMEGPFRSKTKLSRAFVFKAAGVASLVLIIIGLIGDKNQGFPNRLKQLEHLPKNYSELLVFTGWPKDSSGKFCEFSPANICEVTEPVEKRKSILLIGDSHSADFSTEFREYAEEEGLNAWQLSIPDCIFTKTQLETMPDCKRGYDLILEEVQDQSFDEILFVGNYFYHTRKLEKRTRSQDIVATVSFLQALLDTGANVTLFGARPDLDHSPVKAAFRNKLDRIHPLVVGDNVTGWNEALDSLKEYPNYSYYDQSKFLVNLSCGEMRCFNGHIPEMHPLYRDIDHLTNYGARLVFDDFVSNH